MSVVTIMYDVGDETSMGKNNAQAQAKRLSSETFNVSEILNGAVPDETVIEAIASEFKSRFVTNDNALKDNCDTIVSKLRNYFKMWHEKDPNAINPSVVDKLIETVTAVYTNSKKKTVATQSPTEKATNE